MKKLIKQITITSSIVIAIILGMSPLSLKAQSIYKLTADKDVTIKVLGSSNVHDWTMVSSTMESQGDFKFDAENQLHSLTGFTFSLNAKSLKSEHTSMDDRTYKTIKADQFPKISYKLTSAVISTVQKGKFLIKATGDLTIAGVTQVVVLNVTAVVNADNSITCTGSEPIKLTDYKIAPPSFMLGAMKVKNDLTIQFNLIYKK